VAMIRANLSIEVELSGTMQVEDWGSAAASGADRGAPRQSKRIHTAGASEKKPHRLVGKQHTLRVTVRDMRGWAE